MSAREPWFDAAKAFAADERQHANAPKALAYLRDALQRIESLDDALRDILDFTTGFTSATSDAAKLARIHAVASRAIGVESSHAGTES